MSFILIYNFFVLGLPRPPQATQGCLGQPETRPKPHGPRTIPAKPILMDVCPTPGNRAEIGPDGARSPKISKTPDFFSDFLVFWQSRHAGGILRGTAFHTKFQPERWLPDPVRARFDAFRPDTGLFNRHI